MKLNLPLSILHLIAITCALQAPAKQPPAGQGTTKAPAAKGTVNPKPSTGKEQPAPGKNAVKNEAGQQRDAKDKSKAATTEEALVVRRKPEAFQSEVSDEDEKAIRDIVNNVESAFNKHDAKAFAALFAENAEIVNVQGIRIRGRDIIQDIFAAYFETSPDAKLDIEIESLRPLTPSLILEQGLSRVTDMPDGNEEVADYTVIYAKEDGAWTMVYARDSASAEGAANPIRDLAWLIGDWVDESSDAIVASSYRWSENHRYIIGEYVISAPGYADNSGTLRIGWDPQLKQLRSWVFDSNGGFACGLWSQSDEGWTIKMTGVTSDGVPISATDHLKQIGEDHLSFQSLDRTIAGAAMPDGDELVIVRHPPKPETVGEKESGRVR